MPTWKHWWKPSHNTGKTKTAGTVFPTVSPQTEHMQKCMILSVLFILPFAYLPEFVFLPEIPELFFMVTELFRAIAAGQACIGVAGEPFRISA